MAKCVYSALAPAAAVALSRHGGNAEGERAWRRQCRQSVILRRLSLKRYIDAVINIAHQEA